jgi:hypothetical protein
MLKLNPFRSVGVADGVSDNSAVETIEKPPQENDVVNISNEAKKKHVMGKLIARITAESEAKKL